MNNTLNLIIAMLVFPGVLTTLVLTLLVAKVAGMNVPGGGLSRGIIATFMGRGSFLLALGAILPMLAAGFLPWAASPLPNPSPSQFWTVWALLEMSYFAAVLPSLMGLSATSVRYAMRELQLAAAGRLMVWAAIVVSMWAGAWTAQTLPAHVLAIGAALVVLPVAVGWGAFAPDTSLSPAGAEIDFSRHDAQLAQWGRAIRATVLVVTVAVFTLPKLPNVHWGMNVLVVIVTTLLIALMGRTLNGTTVRRTLPDALNWCFTRSLPITLLAVIALFLGRRWL